MVINPRNGEKWAYGPTPGNRNAEKRNVRKGDFSVTAARKMGRGKMSSYSLKSRRRKQESTPTATGRRHVVTLKTII